MITWLLDLLFPPKCVFCHKLLRDDEIEVCNSCTYSLPEHDVVRKIQFTKGCAAPFYYEGVVRSSIIRYKFHGCSFYAKTYGRMVAAKLQDCPAEVVTWVPVNRYRRMVRGYDQAELLAREVAGHLGLPCQKFLKKDRRPKQSGIHGTAARKANVSGAFHLCNGVSVLGKRILLIDDVCTTGATMEEAAMILNLAGAAELYGAVVAHTKT